MFFFEKVWRVIRNPYLCNVFFIVLDLRLTRLGYSGIPFFLPLSLNPLPPLWFFASVVRFSRCADLNGRKVVSSFYSSLSLFGRFLPVRGGRRRFFLFSAASWPTKRRAFGHGCRLLVGRRAQKTQAFPIAHPDLSNFRMKSGGRSTWKRLCAADGCR